MSEGTVCGRCPLCGGKIVVSEFLQKSRDYNVLKDGRISTRYTVNECESIGIMTAGCAALFGASWDEEEFDIGADGKFYDKKYLKD